MKNRTWHPKFALGLSLVLLVSVGEGCAQGTTGDPAPEPNVISDPCGAIPTLTVAYDDPQTDVAAVGDRLANFTLETCDRWPWTLSDAVGSAELTLVNVGAGWCRPCRDETAELEEQVHERFCERGLRVVQILYQDDNATPVTPTFCRGWRDEFGLGFPVLLDPAFTRSTWFDDELAQTPLNLLVDRDGRVVERFVGSSGIEALVDAIDDRLPRRIIFPN